jgi:hypothetical protein
VRPEKERTKKLKTLLPEQMPGTRITKGEKLGSSMPDGHPHSYVYSTNLLALLLFLASSLAVGYVTYTDELDFTSCDKTHSVVVVLLLALILACC